MKSMLNFPPPPPPPSAGNQVLNQLAEYYRQLVDYHQQAAELAAQQLAHIEALLNPILSDIYPSNFHSGEDNECLEDITPLLELPSSDELEIDEDEETLIGQEESTITDDLIQILESNRGKVLHIEYIVRKLYGIVPSQDLLEVTQATKKLLEEGAKEQKWYAMPDSPECWTIDLKEFPDLFISNSKKISSSNKNLAHLPYCSRLPYSEKLAKYDSTGAAISACLQSNYPHTMTTLEVLDWLYPEGVPEARRKKASEAINNVLSKGVGLKGWQKVGPGLYRWTG
ncbi:hypothetical protein PCC7424_3239 [Gloeothece citriformis PCC 7424]|uniref:Uncharacterized protein n=1 Tax=Gloeothece citriformis (strain PCC 7424) TaxID=65393 RepID=B7KCT8_GLOC7|nr:hypothetical protein [Gloeothece citriformis]ACK71639.1 hypothetical protein PCC7424_3239 [Gloeothece citriformis PCC 7424]